MNITDLAKDVQAAVEPRYTAERMQGILHVLQTFAAQDPRRAFGRTVRDHRSTLAQLDETLRVVNVLSSALSRGAAEMDSVSARHFEVAMRQACTQLRICRLLAANLSGDRSGLELEPDDVTREVLRLMDERAAQNMAAMSDDERASLRAGVLEDTTDLEAWLSAT